MQENEQTTRELTARARAAWDANAAFWSEAMGEGNAFHRHLVAPAVERLLEVRDGQRVLDLACGNGHYSRRLVELGATVVAADFSSGLVETARQRLAALGDRVRLRQVDATDEQQLAALAADGPFDAIVSNMALMDMATLEPLARSIRGLLAPGGKFVFSVSHPCFNMYRGFALVAEEEDREGELVASYYLKIKSYIRSVVSHGVGIAGQPVPGVCFHRPLSELLPVFFRAELVLDGLEEPVFPPGVVSPGTFAWENFREIPPVLSVRLRSR